LLDAAVTRGKSRISCLALSDSWPPGGRICWARAEMSPLGRTLVLTVLGVGGINLWLGLGASRLGLAGALGALLAVQGFWHG
jgi:hypothetical protein